MQLPALAQPETACVFETRDGSRSRPSSEKRQSLRLRGREGLHNSE